MVHVPVAVLLAKIIFHCFSPIATDIVADSIALDLFFVFLSNDQFDVFRSSGFHHMRMIHLMLGVITIQWAEKWDSRLQRFRSLQHPCIMELMNNHWSDFELLAGMGRRLKTINIQMLQLNVKLWFSVMGHSCSLIKCTSVYCFPGGWWGTASGNLCPLQNSITWALRLHIVCLMVQRKNTLCSEDEFIFLKVHPDVAVWLLRSVCVYLLDRCKYICGVLLVCVPSVHRQPCLWHPSCSGVCPAPRFWPPVCYHANNTSPI